MERRWWRSQKRGKSRFEKLFLPHFFFAPSTENKIRESQDFSKRSSDAPKYCASVVQPSAASKIQNHKFTTVVLLERALEDSGDEPMAIYCQVIDQAVSWMSTSRIFKTINHAFATYQQPQKKLSCFTLNVKLNMLEYIMKL